MRMDILHQMESLIVLRCTDLITLDTRQRIMPISKTCSSAKCVRNVPKPDLVIIFDQFFGTKLRIVIMYSVVCSHDHLNEGSGK